MTTRHSFAEEHVFVEVVEEMSLEAFLKSLSITSAVSEAIVNGVTEICPGQCIPSINRRRVW